MEISNELSLIMGQRLKALRNEKGISHETLRKALTEKYEIDISVDSLKNYEVSTAAHSKAYKNNGMKVEYLRCLADFYGVSADYLLGLSDVRSPDTNVSKIMQYTGLSESNVLFLHNPASNYVTKYVNDMIIFGMQENVLKKYAEMLVDTYRPENPMQELSADSVDEYIAFTGALMNIGYRLLKPDLALAFLANEFAESIKGAIMQKYGNAASL